MTRWSHGVAVTTEVSFFFEELFKRNNIITRVFDLRDREGGGYVLPVNRSTYKHEGGL